MSRAEGKHGQGWLGVQAAVRTPSTRAALLSPSPCWPRSWWAHSVARSSGMLFFSFFKKGYIEMSFK